MERGRELGLDGFRFYFLGRGGVLGDVEPAVVASAFGYFAPDLVAKMWRSAATRLALREAGRAYSECAAQFGRDHFGGLPDPEAFCSAAESVVTAVHPAGLTLFAGVAAEPRASDSPGRAMQLATVLRELRGGAHLIAVLAVGLAPRVAHYMDNPAFFTAFGYQEGEAPEVSAADRDRLAGADRLTDELLTPAFGALDPEQGAALIAGAKWMRSALPGG